MALAAAAALVLAMGGCGDAERESLPPRLIPGFPAPVQRVAGHDETPAGPDARVRVLNGDPAAGADLYALHCARCHGVGGRGDGPQAAMTAVPPRDFHHLPDEAFLPERLDRVIRDGGRAVGAGAAMPGFAGRMSEAQIADVAAYVERLVTR